MKFFKVLLSFSLLTGCGYRWQPDLLGSERPSITVPYVIGDEDGTFTAEIIGALTSSGIVDVVHSGGEYRLQISIINIFDDQIGYRRDPQDVYNKFRKNLLAAEGRRNMMIEAVVYKSLNDEIAFGPFQISASAEYDYVDGDSAQDLTFVNPEGVLVTVLPFSLGQLEPSESAQEACTRPLYARLARKIVDAMSFAW